MQVHNNKTTQTRLLVSRPHPDKTSAGGRTFIIPCTNFLLIKIVEKEHREHGTNNKTTIVKFTSSIQLASCHSTQNFHAAAHVMVK